MSDVSVRGRFVWHELMTTDTKAAAAFYTKVVGWKADAWTHDPLYTTLSSNLSPMAGLMIIPEEAKAMGAPPSWMVYIGTPDVDQTARRAVELGGKILRAPADIPQVGRFAVLQDPQGAVFAPFTSQTEPTWDEKPLLGDFSWHELITSDWAAALSFYSDLFGWEKTEAMDMGPDMGVYQMYGWPGRSLGGMFNKPAAMPGPPHWLPYVLVQDARKVADLVQKSGGMVLHGPIEVPGGDWIVQFLDPQGAVFAAHSLKPAVEPALATAPVKKVAKPAAPKPSPMKPAKTAIAKKPVATDPKTQPAPSRPTAKKTTVKKAAPKPAAKKPAVKRPVPKKLAKKATAKKAVKKPLIKKSVKKVAPKPVAKKAAKKVAKKVVKQVAKKAARKPAKKVTKKVAKKMVMKVSKKTVMRIAKRPAPKRSPGKKKAAKKR